MNVMCAKQNLYTYARAWPGEASISIQVLIACVNIHFPLCLGQGIFLKCLEQNVLVFPPPQFPLSLPDGSMTFR